MTAAELPGRWSCNCGAKGEARTFTAAVLAAKMHRRKRGGPKCSRIRVVAEKKPRSKPQPETELEAKPKPRWFVRFVEQQQMRQAWCKYGHLGCSNRPGGRCLDEILHQHPELADTGA